MRGFFRRLGRAVAAFVRVLPGYFRRDFIWWLVLLPLPYVALVYFLSDANFLHWRDTRAAKELMEVVHLVKRRLNPELKPRFILPCMVDHRTRLSSEVISEIRRHFGDLLASSCIRSNVKLAEAPSFGHTIFEHAPDSHGAEDYLQFAEEFLAAHEEAPEKATEEVAEEPAIEVPGETPTETSAETPVKTSTEAAAETSTEATAETSAEAPAKTPAPAPVETPVATPAANPAETPPKPLEAAADGTES